MKMSSEFSEFNLLIASVGGQGGNTLSKLIGHAAIYDGMKVVIGETFGMSQRFGVVQAYIRIGRNVHAPLIPNSNTDLLIGLELCETARALRYCSKKTNVILNNKLIPPVYANLGIEKCPSSQQLLADIKQAVNQTFVLDAEKEALYIGSPLYSNTILLGYTFGLGLIPLSRESILKSIEIILANRKPEENKKAFERGIELGIKEK
ncbi:MAG: indolepyruvate oxidoreductase subunit beta [Candidatus Asgardarchaeia archaeon]